jgi:hypothetical protein
MFGSAHSQEKFNQVADQLNNRPRKTLMFETPKQVFTEECCIDRLNLEPPFLKYLALASAVPLLFLMQLILVLPSYHDLYQELLHDTD